MVYENTPNLVSVASYRNPNSKILNINSIAIPVLEANIGASRMFLKQNYIAKLVNIQKLIDGPIAILPSLA